MKNETIIAIDPGSSGGIAVRNMSTAYCYPMPETQGDIMDSLQNIQLTTSLDRRSTVCVLEQVGGYTGKGQPGSAMFKFGENFGFIKGVVQALGMRLILVRPQIWQKHFRLGTKSACASKTEWKNKLKAEAQRRYPDLKITLATADAVLIMDWASNSPQTL